MISNKIKGILSLIGGFCLHFMNGSLYTWASINSYFASYLRNIGNDSITLTDVFFMMPSIFLVQYCFMAFGVKVGDSIGARFSTLIGVCLMTGSYVILLFVSNFILVILSMGIFGCGNGIANISVIKNCWKYLPDHKGLVNGIIIGGLGLSAAVLNPLADFLINPSKEDPDEEGYYSENVTKNLPTYLYIIIAIFLCLSVCAVLLTFPYDDSIVEKDEQNEEAEQSIIPQHSEEQKNSGDLMDAVLSIPNLQLAIFCFAGPFFCFLLTNTNRTFGNLHNLGQGTLQFMAFFYSLLNGSARFLWGYLLDKFGFKLMMYFVLGFELAVSVSVYFIVEYEIIYLIENFIIALCLSGTFTMITPTFNLVFGFKNGAKMYGLTGILIGITSFLGPVLTKTLVNEIEDYMIIYLTGAAFVVIDIITLITFKEVPYIYKADSVNKIKGCIESVEHGNLTIPTTIGNITLKEDEHQTNIPNEVQRESIANNNNTENLDLPQNEKQDDPIVVNDKQ